MAKRSIYAQIDEVAEIIEHRQGDMKRMRGAELSRMEEHLLRLQCVLATLEFVRDHRDIIRELAIRDRKSASGPKTDAPGSAQAPPPPSATATASATATPDAPASNARAKTKKPPATGAAPSAPVDSKTQ